MWFVVYPIFINTNVIIIGSRKLPIEVIILPVVVGIDISSVSFILFGIGFMSCFFIFMFFGKNSISVIVETSSLITLYNIIPVIVLSIPYFNRYGVIIIVIISLVSCSIRFDVTCGSIFCFPKKYPLIIFDIVINGRVILIAIIG